MGTDAQMIGAIHAAPGDRTLRLAYADLLQELGRVAAAAVVREPFDLPQCLTAAADLENRYGLAGLAAFSDLQLRNWYHADGGYGRWAAQVDINREYDLLRSSWRRWLPAAATMLTRRADREAYCKDYREPAVSFPSRRRARGHTPTVTVLFQVGLARWVRCDTEDWDRFGRDLLRLYPWVEWQQSGDG